MFNLKTFITKYLRLQYLDFVPEIRLFLRQDNRFHSFLKQEGIQSYPNWAYSWAGGQALARYVLDNDIVKDKIVVDYCSGGGIVGIAAKLAGAKEVICVDNDPLSFDAAHLNARANGVELITSTEVPAADVILAGDPALQKSVFNYLKSVDAIIGCPVRKPELLDGFISLKTYEIPVHGYMGDVDKRTAHIFR